MTSDNGAPLSSRDPDDWNLQEEWDDQILSLFDDNNQNVCSTITTQRANPAVPNPAKTFTHFSWAFKDTLDVKFRIVDRNCNLLKSLDVNYESLNLNCVGNASYNEFVLPDLKDLNLVDTVRVYYKLVGKSCEFRGHGDIVIVE